MALDYIKACEIVDELAAHMLESGDDPDLDCFDDEGRDLLRFRIREKLQQIETFLPILDVTRQRDIGFMESDFMREYATNQRVLSRLSKLLISSEVRGRIARTFIECVPDANSPK